MYLFCVHGSKRRHRMKPAPVFIKKYGNRRLYDSSSSQYVNLDDIAGFLREGKDVKVVDAKTGQDLTRVTLTQIITEDAKNRPTGLPLELLRQLVLASDEVRQEFLMWYLKSAFDTYEKVQSAVQNRLGEVQSAIFSPVETMKQLLGSAASPQMRASSEQQSEPELAALRKRVAELEARLERPAPEKQSKKRRKPRKQERKV
ncbi:MAG: polyhydroxyalkanoate synthesis regulator DNA-binding domain-containing protein [Terriglobales bacterium]